MKVKLLLSSFACSCAITAIAVASPCQRPNANTKLCYVPTDGVSSCAGLALSDCSDFAVYSINNFPDGAVAGTEQRTTAEELADCWQKKSCGFNVNANPPACQEAANFGPWHTAAKVVQTNDGCAS